MFKPIYRKKEDHHVITFFFYYCCFWIITVKHFNFMPQSYCEIMFLSILGKARFMPLFFKFS